MASVAIVKLAVELLHMPSRVRVVRIEPLPQGVEDLIAIAAGDESLLAEVSHEAERPPAVIKGAANFFIEQVLMAPDADSYRVLGATRSMSNAELRHNMTMLVKWLHPDVNGSHSRDAFTSRVTSAWDNLKTAERRAGYDAVQAQRKPRPAPEQQRSQKAPGSGSGSGTVKLSKRPAPPRFVRIPLQQPETRRFGRLRRVLMSLFGLKQDGPRR